MELAERLATQYEGRELPADVLRIIGELLDPKSVLQMCKAKKRWNQALCLDPRLWQFFWRRDLSQVEIPPPDQIKARYLKAMREFERDDSLFALEKAAADGYEKAVAALLAATGLFAADNSRGYNAHPYYIAMKWAAKHGRVHVLKAVVALLKKSGQLNRAIFTGLISDAVEALDSDSPDSTMRGKETIDYLLELGQNINEASSLALRALSHSNKQDALRYLLSKGARIDADDNVLWAFIFGAGNPLNVLLINNGRLPPMGEGEARKLRNHYLNLSPEQEMEVDQMAKDPYTRRVLRLH